MKTAIEYTTYDVWCERCGNVWTPRVHSALWWKAHQRAQKGFLDAHCAKPNECGCVEKRVQPNAPFRVFGYDGFGIEFDAPCHTFVEAMRVFIANRSSGVVFIKGVGENVRHRLDYGV